MRQYKYKGTSDWRPVPGETMTARVLEKSSIEVSGKDRRYLLVDTGTAIWRVFESAGLTDVFASAARGDYVDLSFLGTAQLKNGNTFKRFRCAVYTLADDDEGAIPLGEVPRERRASAAKVVKRGRRKKTAKQG